MFDRESFDDSANFSLPPMRGAFLHFLTVTPTGFDLLPSNLESGEI